MTQQISNENVYLSRMRRTFTDKAWFMQMIPDDVRTIIDFGSADNSFINFLKHDYPEYRYVGIENNESFFKASVEQGQECYHSLPEFKENSEYDPETTLLVLNSVLHEVYSYGFADSFWSSIMVVKPKYIAVRDMYAKDCGGFGSQAFRELESVIESKGLGDHYKDFIEKWGRARNGWTALHFMLKYFYDENWAREVEENYLPLTYKELNTMLRSVGYDVSYERFYSLPYLRKKWNADFDSASHGHLAEFISNVKTHMKLFLVHEFVD